MKKNPSWEASKKASRSSGVLSWLGSGKAVGIAFPSPENWGGCLLQGRRPPTASTGRRSARSWPPREPHTGRCRFRDSGTYTYQCAVGVGSGIPERDRVAVVGPAHHHAVPEDLRD